MLQKKLFARVLGCFCRVGRTPQLKTAIQAVDIREALADQIGGRSLAGVAVIADHHRRRVQVSTLDESVEGMIVQMLRATDVQGGECRRVSDIDDHRAFFAQGLGLFWGMRLNSLMAGSCGSAERAV